jgi:hypothetical protein
LRKMSRIIATKKHKYPCAIIAIYYHISLQAPAIIRDNRLKAQVYHCQHQTQKSAPHRLTESARTFAAVLLCYASSII